ncbi:hypothetical protein [Mycobacterium kubicae]|uniref:hypothetical protein n=1 Tax=Mycobacterium kubicae TaxID=120959 RepID=UPI0008018DCC|nr:hypothetical protein [Mycobacterium kubicae]OBK45819.1 hypothetical protein A5657_02955 [Mycobacterium kubicae]
MSLYIFADDLFNVSPAEQNLLVAVVASAVNCDPNLDWEHERLDGSEYLRALYASSNLNNQTLFAESRNLIYSLVNSANRIEIRGTNSTFQSPGMPAPITNYGGLYVGVDGPNYDIRVDTSDWDGAGYVFPNPSLTGTVCSFVDTRVYNALVMAQLRQVNYYDAAAEFTRLLYENRYRNTVGVATRALISGYAVQGLPTDGGIDWPACTKPLFKEKKVADQQYSPPKW